MVNDIQKWFFVFILKVKQAFILILFAKCLSKYSQSEKERKYFSHFSLKSTYHDTLSSLQKLRTSEGVRSRLGSIIYQRFSPQAR